MTVGQLAELARWFWPEFVQVRGCVLLAARYDARNFVDWWVSTGGDVRAIEGALNQVHLYDLMDDDHVDDEALRELEDAARRLAACWRAALALQFPGRRLEVSFATEPEEYGPTVSFCQVGPG